MCRHKSVFTWAAIMCSNLTTLMLGICDIIGSGKYLTICMNTWLVFGAWTLSTYLQSVQTQRCLHIGSYHVLQFDNTGAGNLWHYRQRQKLDYMYEHMASAESLDVVNLPTISVDTKKVFTQGWFHQSEPEIVREVCHVIFLYHFICNFFTKSSNQHINRQLYFYSWFVPLKSS